VTVIRGRHLAGGKAAFIYAYGIDHMPEMGIIVMGLVSVGLIGEKELHHHFAGFHGAFGFGLDLHARRWRADAGCRENPLTLNLHHTGATVAVGPVTRHRFVTKMGQEDSVTFGYFPDGLAWCRLDLFAINGKGDSFAHAKSLLKCFIMLNTGLPAA
jgi:hypothetical protein